MEMQSRLGDEIMSSEWTDKDTDIIVHDEIDTMLGLTDVTALN